MPHFESQNSRESNWQVRERRGRYVHREPDTASLYKSRRFGTTMTESNLDSAEHPTSISQPKGPFICDACSLHWLGEGDSYKFRGQH